MQDETLLALGTRGTPYGDRATPTPAEAQEKRTPRRRKMRHPAPRGCPTPHRHCQGKSAAPEALRSRTARGQPHARTPAVTLPAPAVCGSGTQELHPGLSTVGRRVGGLSPGLRGSGERSRGDVGRRWGCDLHWGCTHAHTRMVTLRPTRGTHPAATHMCSHAEPSVPPACHGTHMQRGCVPPACHATQVEVSVSPACHGTCMQR